MLWYRYVKGKIFQIFLFSKKTPMTSKIRHPDYQALFFYVQPCTMRFAEVSKDLISEASTFALKVRPCIELDNTPHKLLSTPTRMSLHTHAPSTV